MPKWDEITKNEKYQNLPPEARAQLKTEWFKANLLPEIESKPSLKEMGVEKVYEWFMQQPDDTGQGYVTSMLGAAGRGFGEIVPGTVTGVGALLGSEGIQGAGESLREGLEYIAPANPIYQDDIAMKGMNIFGNVGSILATGGVGGAVGRGLAAESIAAAGTQAAKQALARQAIQRGASSALYGTGFAQGAAQKAEENKRLGMEGPEAYLNLIGGGLSEVLPERLPFGTALETAAARRMLGGVDDAAGKVIPGIRMSAAQEALEGGTTQSLSNLSTQLTAPEGVETPGLFEGFGEAALWEGVGGGMFGVINKLGRTPPDKQTDIQNRIATKAGAIPTNAVPKQTNEEKLAAMQAGGTTVVDPEGKTAVIPPQKPIVTPPNQFANLSESELASRIGIANNLAQTGTEQDRETWSNEAKDLQREMERRKFSPPPVEESMPSPTDLAVKLNANAAENLTKTGNDASAAAQAEFNAIAAEALGETSEPAIQPEQKTGEVAVVIAESPSPNLPPRATENVEPIPTRKEGESRQDFLDRRDAWMSQYGDMKKGGKTHNDDGTPYQPTVFDEVMPSILTARSQMTDEEANERIGEWSAARIATSVKTLLNEGWTWDAENQRWQQPENNPVPNERPIDAIIRLQGKTPKGATSTAPTATQVATNPAPKQSAAEKALGLPAGTLATPASPSSQEVGEAPLSKPKRGKKIQPITDLAAQTAAKLRGEAPQTISAGLQAAIPQQPATTQENTPSPIQIQESLRQEPQDRIESREAEETSAGDQLLSPAAGEVQGEVITPKVKRIKIGGTSPKAQSAALDIRSLIGEETELRGQVITAQGVKVKLLPFGESVRVSEIEVPSELRGQGLASEVLEQITSEADRLNVPLTLSAEPFGQKGLSKEGLESWYARKGFVPSGKQGIFVREPQQAPSLTPQGTPTPATESMVTPGGVATERDLTKAEQTNKFLSDLRFYGTAKMGGDQYTIKQASDDSFYIEKTTGGQRSVVASGFSDIEGAQQGAAELVSPTPEKTSATGQPTPAIEEALPERGASIETIASGGGMSIEEARQFLARKIDNGEPLIFGRPFSEISGMQQQERPRVLRTADKLRAIKQIVRDINKFKIPVSQEVVDTYGITLPEGYVKQGDLYVFQPQATKAAAETDIETGAPKLDPKNDYFASNLASRAWRIAASMQWDDNVGDWVHPDYPGRSRSVVEAEIAESNPPKKAEVQRVFNELAKSYGREDLIKGEKIKEQDAQNFIQVGRFVKVGYRVPVYEKGEVVGGKTNKVVGKITRIMPDGKVEVRLNQGGFKVLPSSEIEDAPTHVGNKPLTPQGTPTTATEGMVTPGGVASPGIAPEAAPEPAPEARPEQPSVKVPTKGEKFFYQIRAAQGRPVTDADGVPTGWKLNEFRDAIELVSEDASKYVVFSIENPSSYGDKIRSLIMAENWAIDNPIRAQIEAAPMEANYGAGRVEDVTPKTVKFVHTTKTTPGKGQKSGYYPGTYAYESESGLLPSMEGNKFVGELPESGIYTLKDADQLKKDAADAGFGKHSGNGSSEVKYLQSLGFKAMRRPAMGGTEIIVFDTKDANFQPQTKQAAEKQTPVPLREGTGAAGVASSSLGGGRSPELPKVSNETETTSSEKLDTVAQIDRLVQSGAKPEEMDKFVKSLSDDQFNELVASEAFYVDPKLAIKPNDTYDAKRIKRRKFVDAVNASTKEARKTAQQVFQEEEAAAKKQEKLDQATKSSLNSVVGPQKKDPVQGTVTKADVETAREALTNSGEIPNAYLTNVYESREAFLADKANARLFPASYARLQTEKNIEGLYENGQTLIFAKQIQVSNLDRNLAKMLGVSDEQAAARRVIAHENGHKAISLFTMAEKRELRGYLMRAYSEEQIAKLVERYTEYADWRTNPESRLEALEELLMRDFEKMERIPTGGVWDDIVQFLKRVWRRLTGQKGEPTLKNLKDVARLMRNAMKRPAVALGSFTLKDGGKVKLSVRAYHGTPHKVDKFTTAKIGTGEGAQAYGWGLYFAQNKGVAKSYQEALSGGNRLLINGKTLEDATVNLTPTQIKWAQEVDHYVDEMQEPLERAKGYVREGIEDALERKSFERFASTFGVSDSSGNLYTVELLPDEGDFLDWDKPLSEQSEKVKAALKAVQAKPVTADGLDMGGGSVIRDNRRGQFDKSKPYPWLLVSGKSVFGLSQADVDRMTKAQTDATGENIYTRLTASEGSQKAASEYLASLGIPGIRYLDGGSRGAGDGTRNYVIFDENLVRILEENGQLLTPPEGSDIRFSRPQFASETSAAFSAGSEAARSSIYSERDMDIREAIRRAYEAMPKTNSVAVPIGELFAKTEELMPGVTQEEFSLVLQDLFEDNGAVLQEGGQITPEKEVEIQAFEKDNPFDELIRKSSEKSPSFSEINGVSKKFIQRVLRPTSSFAANNGIRVDDNAPLQARAMPDGSIIIGYSLPQERFDELQKMAPQAASQYTKDSVIEELIHVSDLIGLRNQWIASGKVIPFDQFVLGEQSKLAFSLIQKADSLNDTEAESLRRILASSLSLYNDNPAIANLGLNELLDLAAQYPYVLPELVRSLIQLKKTGQLTETAFRKIANVLRKWQEIVLQWISDGYTSAKEGVFGEMLSERIKNAENNLAQLSDAAEINVTTPEGRRAGFVVVMPRAATASRIKAEDVAEASKSFQSDIVEAGKGRVDTAAYQGKPLKGVDIPEHNVNAPELYDRAVSNLVDLFEKQGYSLIEIADSIQDRSFQNSIGLLGNENVSANMAQKALQAVGIVLQERLQNAANKEGDPVKKRKLEKAVNKNGVFWSSIETGAGQLLQATQYFQGDPKRKWMFLFNEAEKEMADKAKDKLDTITGGGTQPVTDMVNQSEEAAADEATKEMTSDAEEDQDAIDLAAGEATLDKRLKRLYEELKDWLRTKGAIVRARAARKSANAAKASLSKEQRDAIMQMSDEELDALEKKADENIERILNTILGKESDAKTPEQKKTRAKRKKMVDTAKKRAEAGKSIDISDTESAVKIVLREMGKARPGKQVPLTKLMPWKDILAQKAKTVDEYRQRILDAMMASDAFKEVSDEDKAKIADIFAKQWDKKRTDILDRMLEREIERKRREGSLSEAAAKALQKSRNKIIELANLGGFDNDDLMKVLGEKFGIKTGFSEAEKARISELADKLQDETLNPAKRNKLAMEFAVTLAGASEIPVAEIIANWWTSSVLFGPQTIFSIGAAFLNGGYNITTIGLSRMIDKIFRKSPDIKGAIEESILMLQGIAKYLGAFKQAGRRAWSYLWTGNVDVLGAAANDILGEINSLEELKRFKRHKLLAENLAKDPRALRRYVGMYLRFVNRLLTSLDAFNVMVTKAGTASLALRMSGMSTDNIIKAEKMLNLKAYKDQVIRDYFDNKAPTTQAEKALVDSYAEAEMYRAVDQLGGKMENADYLASESAMTMNPTGLGGFFYRSITGLDSKMKKAAEDYLEKAKKDWTTEKDLESTLFLGLAYLRQFAVQNLGGVAGYKFIRFASNKFNQGISYLPMVGLLRTLEAKGDDIKGKEAFIETIHRNQVIGAVLTLAAIAVVKALEDEPDDEERGNFWNGGWQNLTPDQKKQMLAKGQKEYTMGFKFNGRWYVFNYQNWPLNQVLAAIGSMSDQIRFSPKQWEEKGPLSKSLAGIVSGLKSTLEIPALSQLGTLVGNRLASKDPTEQTVDRLSNVAAGWVGGFVPRILKDLDFATQPELRKYKTLWEKTASHIPIYRRYVGEDYYDILGQPIKRNVIPGSREFMMGPTEPEYKILGALNSRNIFLTPANAEYRMVGKGRNRRRLTQEEADAYSLETGKGYRQMLLRYGQRALQMPTERARAFLSDKADEVRDRALKKVFRR